MKKTRGNNGRRGNSRASHYVNNSRHSLPYLHITRSGAVAMKRERVSQIAKINVPVIECRDRSLENGRSSVGSFQSITNLLELIGKVKFNFSKCTCRIFHSTRHLSFNNANRKRKYTESKSSVGRKKKRETLRNRQSNNTKPPAEARYGIFIKAAL